MTEFRIRPSDLPNWTRVPENPCKDRKPSALPPSTYAPFESMSPGPVSLAINNVKNFDGPIRGTRREPFSVVI